MLCAIQAIHKRAKRTPSRLPSPQSRDGKQSAAERRQANTASQWTRIRVCKKPPAYLHHALDGLALLDQQEKRVGARDREMVQGAALQRLLEPPHLVYPGKKIARTNIFELLGKILQSAK